MAICCEMISHPQGARYEIKGWLRKRPSAAKPFRSLITPPCENFHSCETPPWHTSAISQPMPPFRSCEILCEITKPFKNSISQPKPHFVVGKTPTKHPLAHECHFTAVKWVAKTALGWENGTSLRNGPSSAKNSNRHLASNLSILKSKFSF